MGSRCAEAVLTAIEKDLDGSSPGILVSSGLVGALQAGARPGDIVADFREAPLPFFQRARDVAAILGTELHMGKILSVDRVLTEPAEKAELGRRERAVAVDMESETLRNWARREGWTFLSIRAILDGVGDRVLGDAPQSDSIPHSLKYAMSHWTDLPLMLRLALRQRRAMGMLSRFLAEYLPGLTEERNETPA